MTPRHLSTHVAATLMGAVIAWPFGAQAQTTVVPSDGFLCCNLRASGAWASDANAPRSGDRILKAGTKVIGLGFGSAQVDVEIDGAKVSIGNDYSRSMPMPKFAERWIVPKDPTRDMSKWTPKIRQSILAGRVTPGMNRKQVLMSLGWPTASATPNLDDPVWSYTASNGSSYKVVFNPGWLVKAVDADDATRRVVLLPK